jgi:hypothetical protein
VTTRLSPQRFEQRISDFEGAFKRLGKVEIARGTGSPQTVTILVEHPGWGAPTIAHMKFAESWVLVRGSWDLAKYAYDLFLEPEPGRFGFHWHDGTYHTHCVDPTQPRKEHHYKGSWIDIFDAFGRFTEVLMGDAPITCKGLTALRR